MTDHLISRNEAFQVISADGVERGEATAWARFCTVYGSWEQYRRNVVEAFLGRSISEVVR